MSVGDVDDSSDDDDQIYDAQMQNAAIGDSFQKERHRGYFPVVLLALKRISVFSEQQFLENEHWIVKGLTNLIRCDSIQIRDMVAVLFAKFVSPKFQHN
jgi:hypothetical protein